MSPCLQRRSIKSKHFQGFDTMSLNLNVYFLENDYNKRKPISELLFKWNVSFNETVVKYTQRFL